MANQTHWRSGLMAIDPDEIETYDGKIIRTILRTPGGKDPLLEIQVKRGRDGLEGAISFYKWSASDMLGEDIPDEKILDPIEELYRDFGISSETELVGRTINAKYFGNRLVGIQKI
jgi:hypothetical protein